MASLRQENVLVSLPYGPSQVGGSGYIPEAGHFFMPAITKAARWGLKSQKQIQNKLKTNPSPLQYGHLYTLLCVIKLQQINPSAATLCMWFCFLLWCLNPHVSVKSNQVSKEHRQHSGLYLRRLRGDHTEDAVFTEFKTYPVCCSILKMAKEHFPRAKILSSEWRNRGNNSQIL